MAAGFVIGREFYVWKQHCIGSRFPFRRGGDLLFFIFHFPSFGKIHFVEEGKWTADIALSLVRQLNKNRSSRPVSFPVKRGSIVLFPHKSGINALVNNVIKIFVHDASGNPHPYLAFPAGKDRKIVLPACPAVLTEFTLIFESGKQTDRKKECNQKNYLFQPCHFGLRNELSVNSQREPVRRGFGIGEKNVVSSLNCPINLP